MKGGDEVEMKRQRFCVRDRLVLDASKELQRYTRPS
jgi:hypothetical protein